MLHSRQMNVSILLFKNIVYAIIFTVFSKICIWINKMFSKSIFVQTINIICTVSSLWQSFLEKRSLK